MFQKSPSLLPTKVASWVLAGGAEVPVPYITFADSLLCRPPRMKVTCTVRSTAAGSNCSVMGLSSELNAPSFTKSSPAQIWMSLCPAEASSYITTRLAP